jgi:hypothetical protein
MVTPAARKRGQFVRFIAAISAFVLAAVLLGTGLAQKIFFSGPEFTAISAAVEPAAPYIVINGEVLKSHDGLQTVTASGAEDSFIGYGRTSDVLAWLEGSDYATITYNPTTAELSSQLVVSSANVAAEDGATTGTLPESAAETSPETPVTNTIVNPAGSDLWFGERGGSNDVSLAMNADANMSVIIASDGVANAPADVRLSWPIPNQTPYSTGFIILGGVFLVVGLLLLVWALMKMKNQHGPKRRARVSRMPKPPKPRQNRQISRGSAPKILTPARGRRALENRSAFVIIPVGLTLVLGLSSCASGFQTGQGVATPTPTASVKPGQEVPLPDVTEPQLARILSRISETVAAADKDLDATTAATRLVGPALRIRAANYTIRSADGNVEALPAIPASPVTFVMPQATDSWPRYVFTVIQDVNDPTVPTTGLVLVQQSPRENYHVLYSVTLEPKAIVPEVAPASVGSAVVAPDSKLLLLEPDQVALAYGDILMKGDASAYAGLFDASVDSLRDQIGLPYKDAKRAAVGDKASLDFTQKIGAGEAVSLATNNSGAIVLVNLNEIETIRPTEAGATVNAEGQTKILAGIASSGTGIESTYGIQLAFYVPPLGSDEKISFLGFSQGLIAAKGL